MKPSARSAGPEDSHIGCSSRDLRLTNTDEMQNDEQVINNRRTNKTPTEPAVAHDFHWLALVLFFCLIRAHISEGAQSDKEGTEAERKPI